MTDTKTTSTHLRPYQKEILELMSSEGRSTLSVCIPCGTGKGVIIAEFAARAPKGLRIVIFVPSRLLLEQMAASLRSRGCSPRLLGTGYNKSFEPREDSLLTVCVYNSAHLLRGLAFDVVIMDEAHHFSGEEEKGFGRVIGGIATKRTFRFSATLPDPDYSLSLRKAIEEGYLTALKIVAPVYETPIADAEVLALIKKHHEWKRVLLYSNSVGRAEKLTSSLRRGGVPAVFMGGETPLKVRAAVMDSFESGQCRCLSTVRVLGEGIDIPCADTCFFVEKRRSKVSLAQCVGRVLRLFSTKSCAYVVAPTTESEPDEVERIESALASR